MTKARIVHELGCSEELFWDQLFFDDDFNRRLFLEELGFSNWRVIHRGDISAPIVDVEIEVTPKLGDLPGPLRTIVGEGLSYREVGRLNRTSRRYAVKAQSAKLGDRLIVEGELYTEALGPNRCRRIFDVRVEAKIFGIGGLLEKRVISDIEHNYEVSAGYITRYAKEHERKDA
ncbi:MAG TPA: DUF2505 family protein [Polyangiaceae bacterium]